MSMIGTCSGFVVSVCFLVWEKGSSKLVKQKKNAVPFKLCSFYLGLCFDKMFGIYLPNILKHSEFLTNSIKVKIN